MLIERIASQVTNNTSSSTIICDDIHHCRTIPGIILSCASTVFLCTWVALHPNVPKYLYEPWWKIFSLDEDRFMEKRIQLMLVALLAPEVILTIAFAEWVDSSLIVINVLGISYFEE